MPRIKPESESEVTPRVKLESVTGIRSRKQEPGTRSGNKNKEQEPGKKQKLGLRGPGHHQQAYQLVAQTREG